MIVYGRTIRASKRKNPEEQLQKAIVVAIGRLAPRTFVCHIPNGGKRGLYEASRLKAMGVKRGVPDLLLILSSGEVAFIEVKAEGGSLSPEQKDFRDFCLDRNTKWACLNDLSQVKTLLEAWRELPYRPASLEGQSADTSDDFFNEQPNAA